MWFPAGVSLQRTGLLVGSISKPFHLSFIPNWKLSCWLELSGLAQESSMKLSLSVRNQWKLCRGPNLDYVLPKKMLCLWLVIINRNAATTEKVPGM